MSTGIVSDPVSAVSPVAGVSTPGLVGSAGSSRSEHPNTTVSQENKSTPEDAEYRILPASAKMTGLGCSVLIVLVSIVACTPEPSSPEGKSDPEPVVDPSTGTTSPAPIPCGVLVGTSPDPDAEGLLPWATVSAELTVEDPSATLTVRNAEGVAVLGQTVWDSDPTVRASWLRFTPDTNLEPLATYEAEVVWSCGSERWSFVTSGDGPIDPALLAEGTWMVDPPSGYVFEPEGAADFISTFLRGTGWRIAVSVGRGAVLTVEHALVDVETGEQERCLPTTVLSGDFEQNPAFDVGPFDLVAAGSVFDVPVGYRGAVFSGVFTSAADIVDARIQGVMDLALVPALCDELLGIACETCPDGVTETCLDLVIRDIPVTFEPGTAIVTRTAAQIAADPDCH